MNPRFSRPGKTVPPRKPLEDHKQSMTVSIEREHREWIRNHYRELGFRSESHAVDTAIHLLMESRAREKQRTEKT